MSSGRFGGLNRNEWGLAAAIVVVRSEMVHIPPAGGRESWDGAEGKVP